MRTCLNCKSSIEHKRKSASFCFRKCRDAYTYAKKPNKKLISGFMGVCNLEGCFNAVWYYPRHIRLKKRRFCSTKCCGLSMIGNSLQTCSECTGQYYCSKSQKSLRNRVTCSVRCRSIRQTRLAEENRSKNPPTKGALNRRIRYSKKMNDWRKEVFERDNYTCQLCMVRGGYLEADHIKPFAYYPDLRFEISNGRTLCRSCHRQTDTYGRRAYANKKN